MKGLVRHLRPYAQLLWPGELGSSSPRVFLLLYIRRIVYQLVRDATVKRAAAYQVTLSLGFGISDIVLNAVNKVSVYVLVEHQINSQPCLPTVR